ncbi:DUF3168 domain-containing protein [Sporolactobacillus nakayamae]|uniref:DUF3168 domain-containing protein n=1 Tax=Sporolactobacillus nakayamae TaxID=269670 RepID=A0A1I2P515_9BACL|nr:DUF3168 domain-containing protein [Sporolactobacillus nakayamae]SFG10643.1 Protein of unknown function [Sporolactobacillus nakayamae]
MTRPYETEILNVQDAVFQRLANDPGLSSAVTGIFDKVPENEQFPYVVFGRCYGTPYRTKSTDGERIELTLDIWSGDNGKKETIDLVNLIGAALEEDLSLEHADIFSQEIKSLEVLEEINDLFHGTLVYEFILDKE